MIADKRILAVIPARGGSKRLPRKNVLDLDGKPLISWTIEAAKNSKYVDRIVVSTDDQEIIAVSKKFGADVPFKRPDELATDAATSIDVVLHCLDMLDDQGDCYDYVMLLQPTSPLRQTSDIDAALEQLIERNDNAVISVCEVEHSPLWCNTLDENNSMENFFSGDMASQRSQELPIYYRLNGALYIASTQVLKEMDEPSFFLGDKISAYVMAVEDSTDIDHQIDFDLAGLQLSKRSTFRSKLK